MKINSYFLSFLIIKEPLHINVLSLIIFLKFYTGPDSIKIYDKINSDNDISPSSVVAVVTDTAKDMNAMGRMITLKHRTAHHGCIDHRLSKFDISFSIFSFLMQPFVFLILFFYIIDNCIIILIRSYHQTRLW